MYLNIQNLVKFYNKENPLIKDLNFTVNKGDFVSFIGESGSGKTTFLKCLAGLEDINSGKISLNDRVLNDKDTSVKPNLRKIGFIFQDYPLFPHLNVIENLKINLDGKYESNLDYYTGLTGLTNLLNRYPHELSGGEQQRVCITRALIREPDLLLMDEPFSNLDSSIKSKIQSEVYKILKKTNTTTILVTHDIEDANSMADRIIKLKDKKIAEETVERVAPNAKITYQKSDKGWVGDVPRFSYSVDKLKCLGWQPKFSSIDAVIKAIDQIAKQEGY